MSPRRHQGQGIVWDFLRVLRIIRTAHDLKYGESATWTRLSYSRHVRDLRLIAGIAAWLIIVGGGFVLLPFLWAAAESFVEWDPQPFLKAVGLYQLLWPSSKGLGELIFAANDGPPAFTKLGALAAIGAGVFTWVYRTASLRLGVVDLFASEICTLCRVGTVLDFAGELTRHSDPAAGESESQSQRSAQFTSQEEYFPVFSANSKDLQILEADVVNEVTAFYTYMKVIRDQLRQSSGAPATNRFAREDNLTNLIYMLFLGYERARKAIAYLIEYEPAHVENTITILLTEVVAYNFLLARVGENNFRYGRLLLRRDAYKEEVAYLQSKIQDHVTETKGLIQDHNYRRRKKTCNQKSEEEKYRADWDKAIVDVARVRTSVVPFGPRNAEFSNVFADM